MAPVLSRERLYWARRVFWNSDRISYSTHTHEEPCNKQQLKKCSSENVILRFSNSRFAQSKVHHQVHCEAAWPFTRSERVLWNSFRTISNYFELLRTISNRFEPFESIKIAIRSLWVSSARPLQNPVRRFSGRLFNFRTAVELVGQAKERSEIRPNFLDSILKLLPKDFEYKILNSIREKLPGRSVNDSATLWRKNWNLKRGWKFFNLEPEKLTTKKMTNEFLLKREFDYRWSVERVAFQEVPLTIWSVDPKMAFE